MKNSNRCLAIIIGLWSSLSLGAHNGLVQASQLNALQLSLTKVDPTCFGYTNGTATVTPTGGQEPYTIDWSNGQHGLTNLGLSAATYSVTVTDASNVSATGSVTLNQPPALVTNIPLPSTSCSNTTADLNAVVTGGVGPYTYTWSNGSTGASIPNAAAGSYLLTTTDAQGCSNVVSQYVSGPLNVELFVTNIPCFMFCDGSINSVVTGGTSPYSYLWSTGGTAALLENLPPGDFSLTVTDANGCTKSSISNVYEPPAIEIAAVNGAASCNGTGGSITVQASGGTPPFSYLWSSGVVGPVLSNVGAGTYFVQVTDANTCQKSMPFSVTGIAGLSVSLNIGSASCVGVDNGTATVMVNPPGGNYTYNWNVQNNPPVTQLNGLAAGTNVKVTVTDVVSGCTGTASATVGAHGQVQVAVTDTDVNCANSPTGTATAMAVNGTAPYNFAWNVGGTTVNGPQISGLTAGAYHVVVTDAAGCIGNGVADINSLSALSPDYIMEVTECVAGQVSIKFTDRSVDPGSAITSWNWNVAWSNGTSQSTNVSTDIITLPENETGTVQLTINSASGCTAYISEQFTVSALPDVSVGTNLPAVSCAGAPVPLNVTGNPNYTYQWSPMAGLAFTNPQNVVANPSESTVYTLSVQNGGCNKVLTIPVVLSPAFSLLAPDDMVTCNQEETLHATATVPVSYIWMDGNTVIADTSSITVPCGDVKIYKVVATDALGCSLSDEVSITGVGTVVNLANNALQGCENTVLQFEVLTSDTNDVITYIWTSTNPDLIINGSNTATPSVTGAAGNYSLTLIATNQNDCAETLEANVSFSDGNSLDDEISPNLCNGLSVVFENVNNVAGVWSFGDGSMSNMPDVAHNYNQPGTYIVSFVPNAACVATYDTTIVVKAQPAVLANFGQDIQNCENNAVFVFHDSSQVASGATYQWNFYPTSITSNLPNPTITFNEPGPINVVLMVTDQDGCADSDSLLLTYHIVSDEIEAEADFCPGTTVGLNPVSDPAYAHSWTSTPNDPNLQSNVSNPIVSPAVPTVYTNVITLGGCQITKSIAVTPNEAAVLSAAGDTSVCNTTPLQVSVSGNGATYNWSDNPNFSNIIGNGNTVLVNPVRNGVFYVRATTDKGCSNIDSVKVNSASVDITAPQNERMLCLGASSELSVLNNIQGDQLTFEWTPTLSTVANPTVSPQSDIEYTVLVRNQFGCEKVATFKIDVTTVVATAEAAKDTVCPGEKVMLTANVSSGGGNYTYEWSPSNSLDNPTVANPDASPSETTVYTVTVTDQFGCTTTADKKLNFVDALCREPYIFVPQVFTPNNDNNNDFFRVRGVNIKEIYFIVYDRWGEEVYKTNDPQHSGWDGTFNNKELTPDSYGWYLRVLCVNGEEYVKKGDVTLLK